MTRRQLIFLVSCLWAILGKETVSLAQHRVFWTAHSGSPLQLASPSLDLPFGTFRSLGQSCQKGVCSESLQWMVGGLPVFGFSLRTLSTAARTFVINGVLPGRHARPPHRQHLDPRQWGFASGKAGWKLVDSQLLPVWQVEALERNEMWVIDAQTGAVLDTQPNWLHASAEARVLDPLTHKPAMVTLAGLTSKSFLESKHVRVLAPDENSPRAVQTDGEFLFGENGSEAHDFDQVQAFFSATTFRTWLRQWVTDKFLSSVTIRLDYPYISPGNAGYSVISKEIVLGTGDESLQRLGRDFDVVAHEYGHHFIGNFVPTNRGDAGALHEGFADYLVYAFKGKPVLTELATVHDKYLRSAQVSSDDRFDNPDLSGEVHERGRLWSALLWQVRQEHGEAFDQVVLRAIMAHSEKPTLGESVKLLLAADASLLADDSGSSSKCQVLSAAVARGLATRIEDVDGSACGIDMNQMAVESRQYTEKIRGKKTSRPSLSNPCGVVSSTGDAAGLFGELLVLLLFPMFVVLSHKLLPPKKMAFSPRQAAD